MNKILMTLIMVISFSIPVFADDAPSNNNDPWKVSKAFLGEWNPLDIKEATGIGLAKSLGIQIAELVKGRGAYDLTAAEGIYDFNWEVFADYLLDEEEQSSIVFGNRNITGTVGTSLQKMTKYGTALKAEYVAARNSTNSAFAQNRNYQSYFDFSLTQPFLKNGFGIVDRSRIDQIKINIKQLDYEKLFEVENQIFNIRQKYWDLVLAREVFEARLKALVKAKELLDITVDNEDLGLTEEPDVLAARANLKQRLVEAEQAKSLLFQESFALKSILNLDESNLLIARDPVDHEIFTVDFEKELSRAYQGRWDIKNLELQKENLAIELKIRKNLKLPELNLTGRYRMHSLDRDMWNAQGEPFSRNHPQYQVTGTFAMPLQNREAESREAQARIDLKRIDKEIKQLKLRVSDDLFRAYKNIEWLHFAAVEGEKIVELQKDKLIEEEERYDSGRSSSKTIVDFQQDVIDAELALIRTIVDYEKSVEGFYFTQNKLLDYAGVVSDGSQEKLNEYFEDYQMDVDGEAK